MSVNVFGNVKCRILIVVPHVLTYSLNAIEMLPHLNIESDDAGVGARLVPVGGHDALRPVLHLLRRPLPLEELRGQAGGETRHRSVDPFLSCESNSRNRRPWSLSVTLFNIIYDVMMS